MYLRFPTSADGADGKGVNRLAISVVWKTVERFLASADEEIGGEE